MAFDHRIAPRRNPTPEEAAYDMANIAYRSVVSQAVHLRMTSDRLGRELLALPSSADAWATGLHPYWAARDAADGAEVEASLALAFREEAYRRLVAARGF